MTKTSQTGLRIDVRGFVGANDSREGQVVLNVGGLRDYVVTICQHGENAGPAAPQFTSPACIAGKDKGALDVRYDEPMQAVSWERQEGLTYESKAWILDDPAGIADGLGKAFAQSTEPDSLAVNPDDLELNEGNG